MGTWTPTSSSGGAAGGGNETLITTQSIGAGGGTFDFTSIPATYNDLRIVVIARSNRASASDQAKVTFNNDTTGGNYNTGWFSGVPAAASSGIDSTTGSMNVAVWPGAASTANEFGHGCFYIPGYANTNRHKQMWLLGCLGFTSSGNMNLQPAVGWWLSTAAINRVTIVPNTGPLWVQFSEARLYGTT